MTAEQLTEPRRPSGAMGAVGASGARGDVRDAVAAERYSFRRPERFDPSAVRSLEAAHEVFARRAATAWGAMLRGVVQVEPLSVDQISYDDYLRAMPSPNMLTVIGLSPLPTPVLLELDLELALALLDRLLGGVGPAEEAVRPAPVRRPTDLESALLVDVVRAAVPAVEEALSAFLPVTGEVIGVEYNPQLVQIAAPADSVLLLSFALRVTQGMTAEGLLTVCYPAGAVAPLLEHVASQLQAENSPEVGDADWVAALTERLSGVDVDLQVRLEDASVPMADLAALRVGDVLRLDHRVERPVRASVGGMEVFRGHPGRRGRRLAVQVSALTAQPSDLMSALTAHPSDHAHRSDT